MERRSFMSGLTGAGLASLFDVGCATPLAMGPSLAPRDLEEHLERYDRTVDVIRNAPLKVPLADSAAELFRDSLLALFTSSAYSDLTPEWQSESRVQRRLAEAMPAMDRGVLGMTEHIENLDVTARHELRERLRREPDFLESLAAGLVGPAESLGVAEPRRRQLERLVREQGARLIHQPPSIVIDDTVSAVRRFERRFASDPETRALLASQFRAHRSETPPAPVGDTPPAETPDEQAERIRIAQAMSGERSERAAAARYARELKVAGGITMGVGGGLLLIGGFAGAATGSIGLLIIATLGAIALIVGLIVLLVGVGKTP
ncbi:MAG: hypothetical protein IV100_13455 [Myxococcales bacterium]|nr:hypothetical protein [Myxococcales bacterium]